MPCCSLLIHTTLHTAHLENQHSRKLLIQPLQGWQEAQTPCVDPTQQLVIGDAKVQLDLLKV